MLEALAGRRIRILLLALLASLALWVNLSHFRVSPGIDFYQYWGVAKAAEYSNNRLGNPYVNLSQYSQVLYDASQSSTDLLFQKAGAARQQLELYQTPLCYLLFAYFPANYTLSLCIFWTLALIFYFAAFVLLSSVFQVDRFWFLSLALLLTGFFAPLHSDLRVANLNSLQLFGLALSLWLAQRLVERRHSTGLTGAFYICLLVFLTLLKPNLLPVTLLLGAHLWVRHGVRAIAPAALASAAFGAILIILPCLWFRSWGIWFDWFKYLGGLDHQTLISYIQMGNFAPAILLAEALGVGVSGLVAAMAAGLAVLTALALALAIPPGTVGLHGWWRAAVRALSDANLSAAAGVLAVLLLSPMVWRHYYLITLLPALCLLSRRHWLPSLAGGLHIFLASGVLTQIMPKFLSGQGGAYLYAVSLVPLLLGVLAEIAAGNRRSSPAAS